ncbi:uncharacterized protein LAJ45_10378 [Morchella importuna]|uniref:uncharacterized protein n=1 Tax=Morchella importuna TaxID=1174673 RepID=UPI001E8DAFEA|nr:uncharacterized protein LAJ45_10378 [Morchella importuna]KAH8145578.1 hypothetical protein LAJ45_10378 [Morchella importuna]
MYLPNYLYHRTTSSTTAIIAHIFTLTSILHRSSIPNHNAYTPSDNDPQPQPQPSQLPITVNAGTSSHMCKAELALSKSHVPLPTNKKIRRKITKRKMLQLILHPITTIQQTRILSSLNATTNNDDLRSISNRGLAVK